MSMLALSFQNTQFDVVDRNNQPWLRSPQIGGALGYKKGSDSVLKLYESNKDEFTDSMTALVELDTEGGKQKVRIFSLRGCHLLAMFARTPVAKEFRKWVLDILERYTQPSLEPPILTKSQTGELYTRVNAISAGSGKIRAAIWSRFQNHFHLSSYKDLPALRYEEALTYLDKLKAEYANGVEMLYLSTVELEQRIQTEVAKALPAPVKEGELLEKPEPKTNAITISMDGGISFMSIIFEGKADSAGRYFVDYYAKAVSIKPLPNGFVSTGEELPKILAEPGIVPKQCLPAIIEAAAKRLKAA